MIVFPGVGSFGSAMETLNDKGFTKPLTTYIKQDRPFFGICLGMQVICGWDRYSLVIVRLESVLFCLSCVIWFASTFMVVEFDPNILYFV